MKQLTAKEREVLRKRVIEGERLMIKGKMMRDKAKWMLWWDDHREVLMETYPEYFKDEK